MAPGEDRLASGFAAGDVLRHGQLTRARWLTQEAFQLFSHALVNPRGHSSLPPQPESKRAFTSPSMKCIQEAFQLSFHKLFNTRGLLPVHSHHIMHPPGAKQAECGPKGWGPAQRPLKLAIPSWQQSYTQAIRLILC